MGDLDAISEQLEAALLAHSELEATVDWLKFSEGDEDKLVCGSIARPNTVSVSI